MITRRLSRPSKAMLSIGAFALIVLLGIVDYLSGTEIAFSVFYLFPVGVAAWYVNRRMAVLCSIASTVAWYLADTLSRTEPYSNPLIPIWNSTTRLVVFLAVAWLLAALRNALEKESQIARIDYLTGAVNSRAFYETAAVELSGLKRHNRPLTILYLDVDDLKQANDRYGHVAGDEVLKATVTAVKRKLRLGDSVARLGGDEFAVLLPEANEAAGRQVAERLQTALRESVSNRWPVSFSMGVLTCVEAPHR